MTGVQTCALPILNGNVVMLQLLKYFLLAFPATGVLIIGTALLSLTVVPWFLWTQYHLETGAPGKVQGWAFVWGLCIFYYYATGFGITLGYHRLFSHLSFKAKWPVKLFVLLFGAASFENSALDWSADHRVHHKHVDEDEDPYDISKGFFYAHIGWLLFRLKPKPPVNNVKDLEADPLARYAREALRSRS